MERWCILTALTDAVDYFLARRSVLGYCLVFPHLIVHLKA